MDPRGRLIEELRAHAVIHGAVTLASGQTADYYVDVKRATLLKPGFDALGSLVAEHAGRVDATAVGGLTMGADPIACAALAGGFTGKAFFVRKEAKQHGLSRRIEGPTLEPGDRCLVVEDVVTTGGSTIQAIDALRDAGHEVVGVLAVLDRLSGGREKLEAHLGAAPYVSLATIDDLLSDVVTMRPPAPS